MRGGTAGQTRRKATHRIGQQRTIDPRSELLWPDAFVHKPYEIRVEFSRRLHPDRMHTDLARHPYGRSHDATKSCVIEDTRLMLKPSKFPYPKESCHEGLELVGLRLGKPLQRIRALFGIGSDACQPVNISHHRGLSGIGVKSAIRLLRLFC